MAPASVTTVDGLGVTDVEGMIVGSSVLRVGSCAIVVALHW